MASMHGWIEVADRVYVRRHRRFDVNCGLVVGADEALLVDTRSWLEEADELHESIRALTNVPVRHVVNTHGHFDHCFGNERFAGDATIWGQRGCLSELLDHGEAQREVMMARLDPEEAGHLAMVRITPPSGLVDNEETIVVGGRRVRLCFLGRGHTDHDLVVAVEGTDVVFAGDLVEQSGPPSFGDAWPIEWPEAVAALGTMDAASTVPGHGTVMTVEAVRTQHQELSVLAALLSAMLRGEAEEAAVVEHSPFPAETTHSALHRTRETLTQR